MIKQNPLLMIPGPTPVVKSIQDQMARETIAFNDVHFTADFKELLVDLKNMWRCDGIAFVVAGSGTMAMEMGVANLAVKGDSVLVCSNGFFGDRYIDICSRKGYDLETLKARWGECVSLDMIDAKLAQKKTDVLVVTHVETSTGVELPLHELCDMLKKKHPDVLLVVDAVAAAGGVEAYMDWGVDVLLTCSQKAFGISPGLSIVWASKRATERRRALPPIIESYVDFIKWIPVMEDTMKYWGTPAVNMIWALREAVSIMKEEGLIERYHRHRANAKALRAALASIGFQTAARPGFEAPTLSVFLYPEGSPLEDQSFRNALYDAGLHVAGCLGDFAARGFRMGHMGNITPHTLVASVATIERTCLACGYDIALGTALTALQRGLVEEK